MVNRSSGCSWEEFQIWAEENQECQVEHYNNYALPCLPLWLVKNSFHTDATGLLLASGHCKAKLHVSLMLLKALSQVAAALVEVGRVEHLRQCVCQTVNRFH